ncbi:uncharacterized protein LOC115807441 [Chanos chanos]|uniref:Uncharacterized protein LOC115807441 n=1 Tax=Chanos chanos TaxID=29144 RepID=A0A6J2UUY0_CHACN|nr:uncharacterized protein LOC115807441 [Chanos chanos]
MDRTRGWRSEVRFRRVQNLRNKRNPWPCHDTSPVPSHYSEPVSLQNKNVVGSLLPLPGMREEHQNDDEEEEEETQSLRSLPTVMTPLSICPKVKRSQRYPRNQVTTGLKLPPLTLNYSESKCTLIVKGTGYTSICKFPPVIKSMNMREQKDQERPPSRAGLNGMKPASPEQVQKGEHIQNASPASKSVHFVKPQPVQNDCRHLPCALMSNVPLQSHITFQSPVVQTVYPITSASIQQTRHNERVTQPLKSVLKKRPVLQRAKDCSWVQSCESQPGHTRLLEPFTKLQEHLYHQMLHSPLPYHATPQQAPCHFLLYEQDHLHQEALPHASQGQHCSLWERTVVLSSSEGKMLPRITMTRPTPSPKQLRCTESRHAA